jgi:hypothetical protein
MTNNKELTSTHFDNQKMENINNKQQSSVEWLQSIELERDLTLADWKQAKEMEKQRIETAYNKGTVHGIDYPESTLPITGDQYYEQTYGGGEQ